MKLVCVYCEAQGKARVLAEVPPLADPTVTHGLCAFHRHLLRQDIEALRRERGRPRLRRFGRLTATLPAVCRLAAPKELVFRGTVTTVGDGGMAVELPEQLPLGSCLRVGVHVAHGPIEVECRLVWTAPGPTAVVHGLAYTEPKPPGFAAALLPEVRKTRGPRGAHG